MSAAAVRSAYVPRTGSLPPGSPGNLSGSSSKRPAFVPRTPSFSVSSPVPVSDDVKRSADAILKLISGLPAPIASPLPPTLLAKQSPRTPPSSTFSSFKAYARSQKRKASDDDNSANGHGHGLGLGLSLHPSPNLSSRPPLKKARTSDVVPGSATPSTRATPPPRSSLLSSPKARSSLRNEITRGDGKGDWSPEQWATLADSIGKRAHALKRLGDAYINPKTAKGHLRDNVPQDKLRGVLLLTDSLCLYLYKNFADERANRGVVSTSSYMQLNGLREFVLGRWNESITKGDKIEIKGMMGLIYLMEAITSDVIARTDMRSLNRMSREVSTASVSGPSPSSSGASPAGGNGRSPASSSQSELPNDLLKLVGVTYNVQSGSQKALQQSRAYLPMRVLKTKFPETYELAINSELADDLLPSNDTLGCARDVDIDQPDNFSWPIELGMLNGVAHVAVFGRALVREFAQAAGKPWETHITEGDSPQ